MSTKRKPSPEELDWVWDVIDKPHRISKKDLPYHDNLALVFSKLLAERNDWRDGAKRLREGVDDYWATTDEGREAIAAHDKMMESED